MLNVVTFFAENFSKFSVDTGVVTRQTVCINSTYQWSKLILGFVFFKHRDHYFDRVILYVALIWKQKMRKLDI